MASVIALGLAVLSTPAWAKDVKNEDLLNAINTHDFDIKAELDIIEGKVDTIPGAGVPTPIDECRFIDEPGSYILTNNIDSTGGVCLQVTADFVTIDLNGFTMTGPGTECAGCKGINAGGPGREAITVLNGTIAHFDVAMDLSTAAGTVVDYVRAIHNENGIGVGGGSRVTNSIANNNELFGIVVGGSADDTGNCIISGNTANRNNIGLDVRNFGQCLVAGNTLNDNDTDGGQIVCPSHVIGNIAVGNGVANLEFVGAGCTDIDNLAPVLP